MTGAAFNKILTIIYVLFAFLIYTSIPIISTYRTEVRFRKSDLVLLAINTSASSLLMYLVFYVFDLVSLHGLLAVVFAVIYLLLGRLIEIKFARREGQMSTLFYLVGLVFVILIIPLQFGRAWLSLGWLTEGVLFATYGILTQDKRLKQAGFAICILCLGAFLLFDCIHLDNYLFVYKYLAVTLGSLVILGAYMYKKMMSGPFVKYYKYFVLANVWLFAMYLIYIKLGDFLYSVYGYGQTVYQIDYLLGAAAVVVTFSLAYLFSRLTLLSDQGTKILSMVLYGIGILSLFIINTTMEPVASAYLRAE